MVQTYLSWCLWTLVSITLDIVVCHSFRLATVFRQSQRGSGCARRVSRVKKSQSVFSVPIEAALSNEFDLATQVGHTWAVHCGSLKWGWAMLKKWSPSRTSKLSLYVFFHYLSLYVCIDDEWYFHFYIIYICEYAGIPDVLWTVLGRVFMVISNPKCYAVSFGSFVQISLSAL